MVLGKGTTTSSTDTFQSVSQRWKGPEWIRRKFTARGYGAHLLYREMREALLKEIGQPVDFIDDGDGSAKKYLAG